MAIGPFAFKLPPAKISALIVERRTSQREYKIILFGSLIGVGCLWFIAFASGFSSGWVMVAVILSVLATSVPLHVRYWARRIARDLPGVATTQTWLFDTNGITVTNENGQIITTPWSVVKRIVRDDEYGYIEDHVGGRSPLPLAIVGSDAMNVIERMHNEAAQKADAAHS